MTEQSADPVAGGEVPVRVGLPALDAEAPGTAVQRRSIFVSNCWLWALARVFRRGGFLLVSKSEWGWWPHVMWSPDMRVLYQFEPTKKKRRRLLPPMLYRGYVKRTRL